MQYDPIKRNLGIFFNKKPWLRILFYKLLDILLLRTWHIKKELKNIPELKNDNIRFLDAGAGFGQYSYFLSSRYKKAFIYAVDVKDEQVEDCNKFFKSINKSSKVQFDVKDLTKYKESNVFSLILSVDVMEHIEEDILVFQNFYNSLKKEGILLISTPSDKGGSDVHDDEDHSFVDEHVRDGYSIEEIEDKLKKAGFTKIISRYSYGLPGKISWLLSMKYPISLVNISKLFFLLLPVYFIITYPIALIFNVLDVMIRHKSGTGLIVKAIK